MYRNYNCGSLNIKDIGKNVILSGWVKKIRIFKSIIFIDLRDMYGITQIKFIKKKNNLFNQAYNLSKESVITIKGIVIERISKNYNIYTGEIEILVNDINIINNSIITPFIIEDNTDGTEELRMKYRYLDIRRNIIKNKIIHRHNISLITRNYFSNKGFIEIETPILIKSTPEGARDFVVPSRNHHGKFYALPQSPQCFKQLLIIGGIDKYFQIVKCFRDEDLRADRQFEFTQIDCEMAFINQDIIINLFEDFINYLFLKIKGIKLIKPWPRITYNEAINKYGTDKPDTRFEIKILSLYNFFNNKNINFIKNNKFFFGISIPNYASCSLKELNNINKYFIENKYYQYPNSIIWIKFISNNKFKSSIDKYLNEEDYNFLIKNYQLKIGDLLLIISGNNKKNILTQLGFLRVKIANKLNIINNNIINPLWIIDFPLLEWNKEKQKYESNHHPFTAPKENDIFLLDSYPEKVKSQSYDMIINGQEIGGGSIRIHKKEIQTKIFKCLNLSEKEINEKFGFFIKALEFGAPPHGGIALGFDRLVSLLLDNDNIKEYIAFPKNNSGKDIMTNSPSKITNEQLNDINIKII